MELSTLVLFSSFIVLCTGSNGIAPICDGENEVLAECANGCDPIECPKSLKEEEDRVANCVAPAVCLPAQCRCRPGYRRNKDQKCIPIGECPGICLVNEEYSSCTQAICRALTCEQKNTPIACPGVFEASCVKNCVCSEGFLRNKEMCVPESECPGA